MKLAWRGVAKAKCQGNDEGGDVIMDWCFAALLGLAHGWTLAALAIPRVMQPVIHGRGPVTWSYWLSWV